MQDYGAGKARVGDRPITTASDLNNEVGLILSKKLQRQRLNSKLETQMTQIKH